MSGPRLTGRVAIAVAAVVAGALTGCASTVPPPAAGSVTAAAAPALGPRRPRRSPGRGRRPRCASCSPTTTGRRGRHPGGARRADPGRVRGRRGGPRRQPQRRQAPTPPATGTSRTPTIPASAPCAAPRPTPSSRVSPRCAPTGTTRPRRLGHQPGPQHRPRDHRVGHGRGGGDRGARRLPRDRGVDRPGEGRAGLRADRGFRRPPRRRAGRLPPAVRPPGLVLNVNHPAESGLRSRLAAAAEDHPRRATGCSSTGDDDDESDGGLGNGRATIAELDADGRPGTPPRSGAGSPGWA